MNIPFMTSNITFKTSVRFLEAGITSNYMRSKDTRGHLYFLDVEFSVIVMYNCPSLKR
jgi:hypothetical protein